MLTFDRTMRMVLSPRSHPLAFHQRVAAASGDHCTVLPRALPASGRARVRGSREFFLDGVTMFRLPASDENAHEGVECLPNTDRSREVGDPAGGVGTEPGLGPAGVSAPRDHGGILTANFGSTLRRRFSSRPRVGERRRGNSCLRVGGGLGGCSGDEHGRCGCVSTSVWISVEPVRCVVFVH